MGFWVKSHRTHLVDPAAYARVLSTYREVHSHLDAHQYEIAKNLLDEVIGQSPRPSLSAGASHLKYRIQASQGKLMAALDTLWRGRKYGVKVDQYLDSLDEGLILGMQLPGLAESLYSVHEFYAREAGDRKYLYMIVGRRVSGYYHFGRYHSPLPAPG